MKKKKPAPLHLLACYVLQLQREGLQTRGLLDIQHDHRLRFESILFFAGDALRIQDPGCDFGLQTTFFAPGDRPIPATLATIRSTLEQCVQEAWMYPPGDGDSECNYSLTSEGQKLPLQLSEGRYQYRQCGVQIQLFDDTARSVVRAVVEKWLEASMDAIRRGYLTIAGKAYMSTTPVPHYELSPRLRPFLQGYAQRDSA